MNNEHWNELAHRWNQLGLPLRPSAQDITFCTETINAWTRNNVKPPRVLILGVTPEFFHLPWPSKTKLLAVDHTQDMIDSLWPGPRQTALCADWRALPVETNAFDIVLSDGGLNQLSFPSGIKTVVRNIHRVLTDGGLCSIRLFIHPTPIESPEAIFEDLLSGRIHDLNVLKLRLFMARKKGSTQGLQLGSIWNAFQRHAPDLRALAAQLGWPLEQLETINNWRNRRYRFYFFSLAKIRHLLCTNPGGFSCERVDVPTYPMGEQCPTITLRRIKKKV